MEDWRVDRRSVRHVERWTSKDRSDTNQGGKDACGCVTAKPQGVGVDETNANDALLGPLLRGVIRALRARLARWIILSSCGVQERHVVRTEKALRDVSRQRSFGSATSGCSWTSAGIGGSVDVQFLFPPSIRRPDLLPRRAQSRKAHRRVGQKAPRIHVVRPLPAKCNKTRAVPRRGFLICRGHTAPHEQFELGEKDVLRAEEICKLYFEIKKGLPSEH